MTIKEAIQTLDETIPDPGNKMVDGAHMTIAMAWVRIKTALAELETAKDEHDTIMKWRDAQIEAVRKRVDKRSLTDAQKELLVELNIPCQYDRRVRYKYGMRLRGFGPGCQPMGGLAEHTTDQTCKYYDILTYQRKLTDKETQDYELDFLGEAE